MTSIGLTTAKRSGPKCTDLTILFWFHVGMQELGSMVFWNYVHGEAWWEEAWPRFMGFALPSIWGSISMFSLNH